MSSLVTFATFRNPVYISCGIRAPSIEYNFDLYNSDLGIDLVLRGNEFMREEHDTYLICNGVRPKIPDFMLNWIPGWYLNLMY
ncbi:hypothetical protein Glove_109g306 [Diversispora epigaea]|uniref:Uncharacterized protein n=1 Tax=Diversispora epigaea TaxID=1348612 RepID=A0A397JCY6_9GLOM|nr:hypothetical protein Glove_109g306 [Diversispora epigaea]